MYFVIEDRLPSLNDYIDACRSSKYKGAKLKENTENLISLYINNAKVKKMIQATNKPVIVHFEWHEKTKRRDADNIASAKKFILDAMQGTGIIPNDNRKYVTGFTDRIIDDTRDYVVVTIEEMKGV